MAQEAWLRFAPPRLGRRPYGPTGRRPWAWKPCYSSRKEKESVSQRVMLMCRFAWKRNVRPKRPTKCRACRLRGFACQSLNCCGRPTCGSRIVGFARNRYASLRSASLVGYNPVASLPIFGYISIFYNVYIF